MADSKRTVLITGCSDGGMGAALAKEFHKAGLHVYATARDVSKMQTLTELGIETLPLDIQSDSSIAECVKRVSKLDILLNNAGASYTMPIVDLDISEAKKIFDLNVWGHLAVTRAFMPLLLESPKAIVVNHTSSGVVLSIPFQSVYNASKAAMSAFSDILRLELQPFDIMVVNLKTGGVKTNIAQNLQANRSELPAGSLYAPAKDQMEHSLRLEWFEGMGVPAEQWATGVVADLLKPTPPNNVWRGEWALAARIASVMPSNVFDGRMKKMTGLDKIEAIIRRQPRK